jgi:type VI secretion system protein ImpH
MVLIQNLAGRFLLKESVGRTLRSLRSLDFNQFCDFMPTGQYYEIIRDLVKFLLIDPLDFDVVLILKKAEVPKMTLSADTPCRLGWSGRTARSSRFSD